MKIREATARDNERIRAIAEQSFQASYALSPREIETIIESEFEEEHLSSRLNDDTKIVLVAEQDDTLQGFVEIWVTAGDRGQIVWLHVEPTNRGNNVGTELFKHALAKLRERVTEKIEARILTENNDGGNFLEQFDFEQSGRTEWEFGDKTFHVEIHVEAKNGQI